MSNDTIPDTSENKIPAAEPVSISVIQAAPDARPNTSTIPDDAPSVSVSAIEVAPAVAPKLPSRPAPALPPRPAPVPAAEVAAAPAPAPAAAPAAAPVAFVTVGGMSIPAPPAFLNAALVEQQAAAVPALPAPPTIPTFPAAPAVESTDGAPAPVVRPFDASISDEGSLPPLTMSPSVADIDFPEESRRSMFDSIWLPEDPVLTQKMEPEVAARRARFQRFVKGTVGGCAAMCVVALFCTLVSHLTADSSNASEARPVVMAHASRTTVETFEQVDYGRAARGVTKAVRARSQARR